MISEKKLQKKASRYANSVVDALIDGRSKPFKNGWAEITGLIESAYFNGFQSGVVWQKKAREEEDSRPFKVESEDVDIGHSRVAKMWKAVTDQGHFIGSVEDATALWKKFGITDFQLRTKRSKVCSIGYSPTKALWFGWSHRAIRGFKTRKQASKFAESVS